MTTTATPTVQPDVPATPDPEPINLYKLGMLFVIRCRYWSCRLTGVTEEAFLPERCDASEARESGQPLGEAACVEVVSTRHLRIASGRYHFETSLRPSAVP